MAKEKENEILTKEQKQFLELVDGAPYLVKNFYFTGGTPLAAFYLQHRLSEDIDLFSEREIHLPSTRAFIGGVQKKLKIQKFDYRQFLGLHNFQLYFSPENILKIDFNY
ncbi:nucleotidyl transferase AbiEii/AbiGii toxin family protein, partial [Candidatus Wolfebacteria bacterium]|nr:nucleotidyl transferase AbiEii/AbiGii toxin family protein [Candidatus Wolfebacteria bacterium]